ncbi:MAG: cell division protein FtsZ [Hyphomicrobium sp.]
MSIKLQLPKLVDVKPRLTVIGVGGAGCNAVNNMIAAGLQGVEFVVANTDAQSLALSSAEHRIQLGANLTEGLGAGSRPEIGEAAAQEALEEIRSHIVGSHMVFIAAGMGGGTGTGAAGVIARAARETGALTVAIVCKPFQFEGARRMRIADVGVQTLREYVDTLIVIPNQNLFRIANERTTFAEAFVLADQVLYSGVACIVELVLKEGLINLDFADVKTVMSGMGTAMMGTGEATGDRRAILAAEEAIANPLLDDVTLKGAKGLLLSISGGRDLTLYEVDEAASRVRQEVDPDANIIVGATFDDNLGDRVRVSIVASGMGRAGEIAGQAPRGFIPAAVKAPQPSLQAMGGHGLAPTYQAPPHAPFVPREVADELHRRLTEALQGAQPIAAMPHSQPEDFPDQIRHVRESAGRGEPRPTWAGPGNVTIEEGLAHLPLTSPQGYDQNWPRSDTQGYANAAHATFQPGPPVAVPRNGRRMPAVEDFPQVGQKSWKSRQQNSEGEPPVEARRSVGFFGRITGLGRRAGETSNMTPASGQNASQNRDHDLPPSAQVGRERR